MDLLINVPKAIGAIGTGIVTYTTMTGDLQKVITFADPLNEMAFAAMGLMLTIGLAITAVQRPAKTVQH
jgi:hypothetical protein